MLDISNKKETYFTYVMLEAFPYVLPSELYVETVVDAHRGLQLDSYYLKAAYALSKNLIKQQKKML